MGSFGTPVILGASREDRQKRITFTATGSASYATGGDTLDLTASALTSAPFGFVRVDGVKLIGVVAAANSKYNCTYVRAASGAPATGLIKIENLTIVDAVGHTHVPTPVIESDSVRFVDPDAPDLVSVVATVDAANGAQIIALQPDYARHLQLRVINAGAAITAGTMDLIFVGAGGEARTQSMTLVGAGAGATTISTWPCARLTSATVAGLVGGGAGQTVSIGMGNLALPRPKALGATAFAVFKTTIDGADEAPGTVDATAGSFAPTSAPNAARDYDVWFNRTVTEIATASSLSGAAAPAEVANATNLSTVTFVFEATGE